MRKLLSITRICLISLLVLIGIFGSITLFSQAAQANLVLYLPMNEGSGTLTYDDSGNGLVGVIDGATWVTGIKGKALEFDGINDYLYINNTNILNSVNAVTIACWIKVREESPLRYFVSSNGFGLFQDHNFTGLAIHVPATNNAKDLITYDVWIQITGTFDGTDIKFYVDGVLKETKNWPGTMSLGVQMFVIAFFNNEWWKGAIDEVCVWNKALTATEVESHFENTHCGSFPLSPIFLALLSLAGVIIYTRKRK